ncbi:MAG: HEPN domain-containing protein [Candidatus Eremiobacteraeota bacterium]|nr:HEPN domain-containing protein [Candidatus Eremiobacteraeota bacterium]MBC5825825.1 HEPN domain-containing protein [Candidatus Eremiobacteraeota bacterium]
MEIAERYPSRACFRAQQTAELALKAALIALAGDHPGTHVADVLVSELTDLGTDVPAEVIETANRLDLFYTGSRYPDALAGADPLKVLQADDAEAAAARARTVCDFVEKLSYSAEEESQRSTPS